MELRSLRYFLEIARRGNFTAAASALNLTQPTLSRQMRKELPEERQKDLLGAIKVIAAQKGGK